MAITKLKKFKINTHPSNEISNTLAVGDIVHRQYFDGEDVIYSLMYVHEVGTDTVESDGADKKSHYFIGSLLYGDEPKNNEVLEFVRITSLTNPNRAGAIYLTASDNDSPYMDVLDGLTGDKAVFYPSKIGANGYEPINTGIQLKYDYKKEDRFRVVRITNDGSGAKTGIKHSSKITNTGVWLVSMFVSASKAANINVKVSNKVDVDANYTEKIGSEPTHIFLPVTTTQIDMLGRDIEIYSDELNMSGDWLEVSDLVVIQLSDVVKSYSQINARIGKLDGIHDKIYGHLSGYGAYLKDLWATRNANVAGTITAGDKDGFGASFYAGKIHKNILINSLGINFLNNTVPALVKEVSPFGVGNVYKSTSTPVKILAQSKEWVEKNINKQVCFSVFVKAQEDVESTFTINTYNGNKYTENIHPNSGWMRINMSLFLDKVDDLYFEISGNGLFTAPQLEFGDKPTLYQSTDSKLNYTDEYGAWFNRGGIGGTIQNPLLKLNEDGSIESQGDGFKINEDGSGHLAGGALTFDDKHVNISFTDSNIGEEVDGAVSKLDKKIDDEVGKLETNFEIKEGQISSSVKEVREKSEQISSLGNQIKTVGEQASKDAQTAKDSATNAKSSFLSAQEEATRAKEQATNAQTDAIKAKTQAEDAQKKAELASLKAEEALKSADGSSQSYLQAKENAELAKKDALLAKEKAELAQAEAGLAKLDADRAKTEADRASSIKTSIVELETSVTQTAEKVEANATKVEENVSLSNQSVLDAQAQADKAIDSATDAYNNALDASKKAKEALNSAGLSSEEYKKAKLEAEKANADALKAQSEAEKAQDKANEVALSEKNITEMEANILLTAEGIESQVTKVDTIAKHVDENALLAQSNALLAKKNAESAVSSAEEATLKAEEASLKAEEALASAGSSSQSYLDALAEAKKAKADAVKANSDAQKALDEANRAKEEADKAELVAVDVTEKYTSIQQTADEIALTATEVQTNLDISNEAIEKTAQNVADAKKQAESATLKATEANEKALLAQKKADEAKASAGKSSTEYLNAKAEAEKAKADAVKANTKAEEANQSALDVAEKAQEVADALTTVIKKETSITQTAEEIVSIATSVNADATSANEAVKKAIAEATKSANSALEAQTNASSSKAQAEEAAKKALEATEKAEEALENAGASSESYLLAKKEAELAVKEAEKATEQAELSQTKADLATEEADRAKEEADKAALVGADVTKAKTEVIQTAEEIKTTATKVTTDAETAEASATKATAEATKSATNAANAKKDALSAKTQATNAQTKALEAAAKAEEALASAGESSESYLKAKTEAELANQKALDAQAQAELSQTKAELATKEANRAKSEADKAVLLNEDVTEKYTEISQTADEIALTATEVQTNAKKATDASLKAQADATKATKEALDAATKAEEALASAGASSKSYLDAKAEAENALKRANDANAKAKEASESATASKNALTEVKSAQTAINQTAKEVTLSAQQVSGDVQKVSDFVDTAKTNADLATAEAIKANAKALEAEQKAKDALASAGQSSASYKNALAEAERAKKEAATASEKATQASKDAQKAIESANKAIEAEASINLKADGIVMEASQKAADKAIDGLEIGGVNLALNSNAFVDAYVTDVVSGINFRRVSYTWDYSCNIPLPKGTYTFSVLAYNPHDVVSQARVGFDGYSYIEMQPKEVKLITRTRTFSEEYSGVSYILTDSKYEPIAYGYIKLEKGNKATDWTPAPEDIDAQFTETKAEFKVLSDKIESNVKKISEHDGKISKQQTQISQNAQDITSKASKTDVDSLTGRVTKNESSIKQSADKIESNIKAVVKAQGDANAAKGLAQSAQDSIDGLEIGGRNLWINTVFDNGEHWQNVEAEFLGGGNVRLNTGTITSWIQNGVFGYKVESDGVFVISFSYRTEIQSGNKLSFYIYRNGYNRITNALSSDNWVRVTKKISAVKGDVLGIALQVDGAASNKGVVFLKGVKLEKGNKATDWTPAPEDTEAQISELESNLTQTNNEIKGLVKKTDYDANNKVVNSKISEISQKSDKISLQVTEQGKKITGIDGRVKKTEIALEPDNIWLAVKSNSQGLIDSTTEEIKTSLKMTDKGISMIGKEIDMTGGITFSMMKDGAGNTLIQGGKVKTDKLNVVDIVAKGIRTNHIEGLTLNFTKGKIGGWGITSSAITKNNVSLTADGSIQNGAKWQLKNDGSGMLASNNIRWDAAGNVTFSGNVKVGLDNLNSTIIANNKIKTELIDANMIVTNDAIIRNLKAGSIKAEKMDIESLEAVRIRTSNLDVLSGATIGGFEIGNGRIGTIADPHSSSFGNLAIYKDFFRVGGSNGYAMLGNNVIPATAGGAFTAVGRIVNNTPNTGAQWGLDASNYGLFIDVTGGTTNYGISSNAPLKAPAFINTRLKLLDFVGTGYKLDFSQHNIFSCYTYKDTNVTLPNETEVAKMFGLPYLPQDFAYVFIVVARHGTKAITFKDVYNNNNEKKDLLMWEGDANIMMITKSNLFKYQILTNYH